MRLPEQKLWDRFRLQCGADLHLERIENLVGVGIPDVLCLNEDGGVCFIELKANETPPVRASTPLLGAAKGLSQDQKNWHLDWTQAGGKSFILLSAGAGREAKHFLVPSTEADSVNGMTLELLHGFTVGWIEIKAVLQGQ